MHVTVNTFPWAAFFTALGGFITLVVVPSVLAIIRELRKGRKAGVEGRAAIVEATDKNTAAIERRVLTGARLAEPGDT